MIGNSLIILKEGLERVEKDEQGTDSLQNREEALLSWGEPMDLASPTVPSFCLPGSLSRTAQGL